MYFSILEPNVLTIIHEIRYWLPSLIDPPTTIHFLIMLHVVNLTFLFVSYSITAHFLFISISIHLNQDLHYYTCQMLKANFNFCVFQRVRVFWGIFFSWRLCNLILELVFVGSNFLAFSFDSLDVNPVQHYSHVLDNPLDFVLYFCFTITEDTLNL